MAETREGLSPGNRASEAGGANCPSSPSHPGPHAPSVIDEETKIPSDTETVVLIHQSHIKCLVIH